MSKFFLTILTFSFFHLSASSADQCASVFKSSSQKETAVSAPELLARNVMDEAANERLTIDVMKLVADHRQKTLTTFKDG